MGGQWHSWTLGFSATSVRSSGVPSSGCSSLVTRVFVAEDGGGEGGEITVKKKEKEEEVEYE